MSYYTGIDSVFNNIFYDTCTSIDFVSKFGLNVSTNFLKLSQKYTNRVDSWDDEMSWNFFLEIIQEFENDTAYALGDWFFQQLEEFRQKTPVDPIEIPLDELHIK